MGHSRRRCTLLSALTSVSVANAVWGTRAHVPEGCPAQRWSLVGCRVASSVAKRGAHRLTQVVCMGHSKGNMALRACHGVHLRRGLCQPLHANTHVSKSLKMADGPVRIQWCHKADTCRGWKMCFVGPTFARARCLYSTAFRVQVLRVTAHYCRD